MKDIPGLEGLYAATKDGRIWRYHRRWKAGRNLAQIRYRRAGWCTVYTDKLGYKRVVVTNNGITQTYFVHRLAARAFLPNPEQLPQINHIDGNPSNNNIENLEWCTALQNARHKIALGRTNRGEKAHFNKLKPNQVVELRNLATSSNLTQRQIGKLFGISQTAVRYILNRRNWGWLASESEVSSL